MQPDQSIQRDINFIGSLHGARDAVRATSGSTGAGGISFSFARGVRKYPW